MLKGKKLTNIRTHSKDEAVRLTPPIQMTLEKAIAYIQDGELVEATPKSIRLRKALLDPIDRKRAERAKSAAGRRERRNKARRAALPWAPACAFPTKSPFQWPARRISSAARR